MTASGNATPIITRVENYADIGRAVRVTWATGAYHVDFQAFTYFPEGLIGARSAHLYQRAGAVSSLDPVESLDEAEVFAEGSVKWDGCANFTIGEPDECIHTCDREGLIKIGTLLARVHDIAAEMMPMADFKPATTREQREGASSGAEQ